VSEVVGLFKLLDLKVHRVPTSRIMEMKQMIERLLAWQEEMKAKTDADRTEMLAKISARMDENTKETNANTKAIQERMEADKQSDREEQKEMMKATKEDIKSRQAEMRSIVDAWMTDIKDGQKRRPPAKMQWRRI
jgi:DNA anti-recombination protein RmuC